mmetsp:Transcript_43370/g.113998  ORF Transcript_43370/g.113998 Transcript_43370/m.113998 type:complete len:183 (-) Transcript_43370:309-857(-)
MSVPDFSIPIGSPMPGAPAESSRQAKIKGALMHLKSASASFFNPREFSRPASQSDWIARVTANARAFSSVYALLFTPILINTMMSSNMLCLGSLVIFGLWGYAYWVKAEDEYLFGIPFSKFLTCAAVSVLVMLLTGMLNALISCAFLFSLVAMPHLSFHAVPGTADAMDAQEMQSLSPRGGL